MSAVALRDLLVIHNYENCYTRLCRKDFAVCTITSEEGLSHARKLGLALEAGIFKPEDIANAIEQGRPSTRLVIAVQKLLNGFPNIASALADAVA